MNVIKRLNATEIIYRLYATAIVAILFVPALFVIALTAVLTASLWTAAATGAAAIATGRNMRALIRSAAGPEASPSPGEDARRIRPALLGRLYLPQPARRPFLYGSGWDILGAIWRGARRLNRAEAAAWRDRARTRREDARRDRPDIWDYPADLIRYASSAGMALGSLIHPIAGGLATIFIGVALAVALWLGVLVTGLLMILIGLFNRAQAARYRMSFRCPNCHEQMSVPVIICPVCGERHTRLWPSVYGVFRHTCVCGERLPTLDRFGRRELVQRCPSCDHVLNKAIGRATNIHIPIVGGPSAGKTHYLTACVRELMQSYGPAHRLSVTMPDEADYRAYQTSLALLNQGQQLGKTTVEQGGHTRAYNLQIRRRRQRIPTLLYIYDGAGEYYTDQDSAAQQVYYRYVTGFIMIVDPFTIEGVHRQYADRLQAAGTTLAVNAQERLSGIYERMLETLEIHYDLQPGVRFPHPIAVVLTKLDAFDLQERIGGPAARREMARNPDLHTEEQAIHALVQRFLIRNGEGNLVRNLYAQFEAVRFFACSSTGRIIRPEDHRPLTPERVLDPLLWLLAQTNVLPAAKPTAAGNGSSDSPPEGQMSAP